jgi:hypothetical protein
MEQLTDLKAILHSKRANITQHQALDVMLERMKTVTCGAGNLKRKMLYVCTAYSSGRKEQ